MNCLSFAQRGAEVAEDRRERSLRIGRFIVLQTIHYWFSACLCALGISAVNEFIKKSIEIVAHEIRQAHKSRYHSSHLAFFLVFSEQMVFAF